MKTEQERSTWADYRHYYGHCLAESFREHSNIMSALALSLVLSLPVWVVVAVLMYRWLT